MFYMCSTILKRTATHKSGWMWKRLVHTNAKPCSSTYLRILTMCFVYAKNTCSVLHWSPAIGNIIAVC